MVQADTKSLAYRVISRDVLNNMRHCFIAGQIMLNLLLRVQAVMMRDWN